MRTYLEKYHAEQVIKRVSGVAGIANDLMLRLSATDKLDDPQIARAAVAGAHVVGTDGGPGHRAAGAGSCRCAQ